MSASNVQPTDECYVYHSSNGIDWQLQSGPFPPSQAQQKMAEEEDKLKRYQGATRQPGVVSERTQFVSFVIPQVLSLTKRL